MLLFIPPDDLPADDRAYLAQLYSEHYRLMFAAAWRYTSEPATAQDIVSESCVALMKAVATLRTLEEKPLRAYIVSAVRNTAINHLPREKSLRARMLRMPARQNQQEPLGKIMLQEELRMVAGAINALGDKERLVLQLKLATDLSNAEIAHAADISENSVRTYLHRARTKIRQMVVEGGEENADE